MALQAIAGSKFYIGTKVALPPDLNVALSDFAAQESEWIEVNGWTNAGALGDARSAISQDFIGADRTVTIKGTANSEAMQNVFSPIPTDPGQIRMLEAFANCSNYAFKVEWGAKCASEGPVTIRVADPGIVTWPGGHGLEAGSPVIFEPDGGNLPTGLSPDTVYYVVAPITPTTFAVAATPGGAAIETTLAATADTITATAQPAGQTELFYGLVMSRAKNGGEANTALMSNLTVKPNTNIVTV